MTVPCSPIGSKETYFLQTIFYNITEQLRGSYNSIVQAAKVSMRRNIIIFVAVIVSQRKCLGEFNDEPHMCVEQVCWVMCFPE